ncbi:hypothetical protein MTR_1g017820 [Medicago truncatula]|uniref:RNase H type-1 domain-containing protein n=1 Tax=Medicago truncatula TaxID=3880 RepID=G7IBB3_MEDTR|nr:hypothetical protein MTR_1g017820 [Medicago truncatula]
MHAICAHYCGQSGASSKAKKTWIQPILDVEIGEALDFLLVLNWVHEIQLKNIDFELDAKSVLDRFYNHKNVSEC